MANGVVYIGSNDDEAEQFYALNASTGALLWSLAAGPPFRFPSPAVANGVVYVGSERRQRICAERQHRRHVVEL